MNTDILDNLREKIRFWGRAREELPLCRDALHISQDLAIREICRCVQTCSSDRKLWAAACRLQAARGLEDDLLGGVRNVEEARKQIRQEQGG